MKSKIRPDVILTNDERDILHCINAVERDLKINSLIDSELNQNTTSIARLFDLLTLKTMLLSSILKRTRVYI